MLTQRVDRRIAKYKEWFGRVLMNDGLRQRENEKVIEYVRKSVISMSLYCRAKGCYSHLACVCMHRQEGDPQSRNACLPPPWE